MGGGSQQSYVTVAVWQVEGNERGGRRRLLNQGACRKCSPGNLSGKGPRLSAGISDVVAGVGGLLAIAASLSSFVQSVLIIYF